MKGHLLDILTVLDLREMSEPAVKLSDVLRP